MIHFSNVTYTYPHASAPALANITLSVKRGELVLCTGPSGCGKSTVIRVANGLIPHHMHGALSGNVYVGEADTKICTLAKIAKDVGTLFQDPEQQFFALSVADEIAVGLQWRGWSLKTVKNAVFETAEKLHIHDLLDKTIFELSEGQKQKVALASLLAANPKALILDEPSANLDPESAADFARTLLDLKKTGLALLVVDHRLSWLMNTIDRLVVLQKGEIAYQGDAAVITNSSFRETHGLRAAEVVDIREELPSAKSEEKETSVFFCERMDFSYDNKKKVFSEFSFGFKKGDICALVGSNGAGKTTLARILTGLEKSQSGTFFAQGKKVHRKKLACHAQAVLQNAGHQLRMRSVYDELFDAGRTVMTGRNVIHEAVQDILVQFSLGSLQGRHPQSLSGGEKQRLAIAVAAIRKPKLFILDEPTSGLDGKNMVRIGIVAKKLAEKGASVLLITHDLELINNVCRTKIVL